MTASYEQDFGL